MGSQQQQLVVVASKNVPKISATRQAFGQMLPGDYDFQGVCVDSGVSDQPFSDKETLLGATNRAQNARQARPEAQYWVGIEGGVEEEPEGGAIASFAWIIVIRSDGQVGRARTSVFYLSEEASGLLRGGVELGEAEDRIWGRTGTKNDQGSVGLLTGGVVDRAAYYTQAAVLALIPFRNSQLSFPGSTG